MTATLDLEKEAAEFRMRSRYRDQRPPIKNWNLELTTIQGTLSKLKSVREDVWHQKIITSDPKLEAACLEAVKDIDEKIADYENQLVLAMERRRGLRRGKPRFT